MSILIKGIDMPKENQICKIEIHPDGHCAVMKIEEGDCYSLEFNSETKATQIPTPHGRLVDIDKVKDKLRDQIPYCGLDMTYSNSNAFDAMDNAPTILEAEEDI